MRMLRLSRELVMAKPTTATEHEWILHEAGVSKGAGAMWWHKMCNETGSELCKTVTSNTPGAIEVRTESVDSFMRSLPSVRRLDILKIDAEGHDPAVLAGAAALLSAGGASVVTFEYNPGQGGLWRTTTLTETVNILDGFGYDCYFDSNPIKHGGVHDNSTTPSLYLITGECLPANPAKRFRGWSNVVCASRSDLQVAARLRSFATLLSDSGAKERSALGIEDKKGHHGR